jgi:hypothetical protein
MPLVLADRVRETTTTTGTGTVTLAGAVTGFQSFTAVGDGNTTYYTIAGQGNSEWEIGIGTYTASGTTLSRDTVLSSSAGAPTKTNFTSGIKDVFVTYPAERSVYSDGTNIKPDNSAVLLPVSGGTGLSSFTANGIVYASSTSALATSSALTFDGTNFSTTGTVTSTSDDRLKTNWRSVTDNFLEKLAAVKSGVYDRTDQELTQAGVSAQSLKVALPEAVLINENEMLSVAYGNAALVACVELAKKVIELEARLVELGDNRANNIN